MRAPLLLSVLFITSLCWLGCEKPPPPPEVQEEIPEAYKIMMAQREARRQGKTSPEAPDTIEESPSTDNEREEVNYAEQAEAALVQGNLDDVITLCEQAQSQGSPCITSHAMAHYLKGHTREACTLFEKAKRVDVLSPELLAIHQINCIKKSAAPRPTAPAELDAPELDADIAPSRDVKSKEAGTTPLSID